jgi:hypothetical protein
MPICYVSDMSRLLRCLPHTAAECRPSSEPQGLFQCVTCVLLRNPVARFVGKIIWTGDRLKRNSLFGAEDGLDLPDGLLSVLHKTQTHTQTHTHTHKHKHTHTQTHTHTNTNTHTHKHIHTQTHTHTNTQIKTYETKLNDTTNQSAPSSACAVSSVILSVEGWNNCKTHFNGRWASG